MLAGIPSRDSQGEIGWVRWERYPDSQSAASSEQARERACSRVPLLGKVYCQLELIVAAAAVTELSIFLQGGCTELIRQRDKLLNVLCESLY
jgi:hypothetical protein